jgi:RND family efflux transporter MFP subunit
MISLLALSGCEEADLTPAGEVSRPVVIQEVTGSNLHSGLRFPGRVRAVQRASLAFNVPGQIVEFPVQQGEKLQAGALIARLDPTSFEVRLSAARAQFDEARINYERVRKIWETSQAVAKAEVDQKMAAMAVARSSYASARQDAEDTRLVAPFDGVVTRRYVENFQNIQAKEPIVSLQNVDDLEIVIHVPERVMLDGPRRTSAYAQLEGIPGRRFPVTLKSYSAEADPQTQTYEVVLGLTRPDEVTVLPGMSAEILLDEAAAGATPTSVLVPLKAVGSGPDGTPRIWIVSSETSRVESRPIEVGTIQGSDIVVLEGLQAGDRIVTSGLGHLHEGMLVRPL